MNTVHSTIITASCPHGGKDVYEVEFHIENILVTVEEIQKAIDKYTKAPLYQEDLTQKLANRLECLVVTNGRHGKFSTVCRAEPKP